MGAIRIGFNATELDDHEVVGLERAGVDSLWSAGHLWMHGPVPESLTAMLRLAMLTSTVQVGTAVTVLPLYPPLLLAKMTAEIDRYARGRTVLGVGVGGEFALEFEGAGVPVGERGRRTDETIGLLRRWWAGEAVDCDSSLLPQFRGLRIEPGPARIGGPPIVIGGRRPGAMRRAGALGDGWLPMMYSPRAYARSVDAIATHAAEAGRSLDEFAWMYTMSVVVGDDVDAARRAAIAQLRARAHPVNEEAFDQVATVGDIDAIAEAMAAFVQAGVRHFVITPLLDGGVVDLAHALVECVLPSLERMVNQ